MSKLNLQDGIKRSRCYVTETLGAEVLVRSTNQPQTSYVVASSLSELKLKKILMDKMEENKSIGRSDVQKNLYRALLEAYNSDKDLLSSYGEVVTLKRGRDDQDKYEEPSAGSKRGSKQRRSGKEESSKETTQKKSKSTSSSKGTTSSFNEFMATPIDFSAFMLNRLNIQHLTQDLLTGPTYDLIKGMCKSVVKLEYHLEEIFKATNDQLDWHNPEGRSYHHESLQDTPFISGCMREADESLYALNRFARNVLLNVPRRTCNSRTCGGSTNGMLKLSEDDKLTQT
ncbi:hypothetical protein Tco_0625149 [Tanacetum coccineum]|uniref:Uncharacterized protein n=1 Tax=Tanacetum coccineum TaxID=301880 RepID=A0ABQ4WG04_9ASTR